MINNLYFENSNGIRKYQFEYMNKSVFLFNNIMGQSLHTESPMIHIHMHQVCHSFVYTVINNCVMLALTHNNCRMLSMLQTTNFIQTLTDIVVLRKSTKLNK